jgi:hypothetical protein
VSTKICFAIESSEDPQLNTQHARRSSASSRHIKRVLLGNVCVLAVGMALAVNPAAAKSQAKHKPGHNDTEHVSKEPFGDIPKGPLQIFVSINQQKLHFYSDGVHVEDQPVATGVPGHLTPMGVFSVIERDRNHHSNIYDNAPMPFMERITWSGVALHEGQGLGHQASHGCIRMPHDFAARLWQLSTMGMRVIIAEPELRPGEFADPHLFVHKVRQTSPAAALPKGVETAQTVDPGTKTDVVDPLHGLSELPHTSNPTSAAAPVDEATPASAATPAAVGSPPSITAQMDPPATAAATPQAPATTAQPAEAAPSTNPATLDPPAAAAAATPTAAAMPNTAADPPGYAAPTKSTARPEPGNAALPTQAEPVKTTTAAAPEPSKPTQPAQAAPIKATTTVGLAPAKPAVTASPAAAPAIVPPKEETTAVAPSNLTAPVDATLQDVPLPPSKPSRIVEGGTGGPIAIFVSRKEHKIYVRQDFTPVFDAPITIEHPEQPLGTHVFTAMDYLPDHSTLRWTVVSLPGESTKVVKEQKYVKDSHGKRKRETVEEKTTEPQQPPETPQEALARIEIPQDVIDQISHLIVPGSSLVVSDQGLGQETGSGTDFIVITR